MVQHSFTITTDDRGQVEICSPGPITDDETLDVLTRAIEVTADHLIERDLETNGWWVFAERNLPAA